MELRERLQNWEERKDLNNALALFDLNINATKEDLNKQYRTLARKYHPDGHAEMAQDLRNWIMSSINTAYDYLDAIL